MTKHTLTRINLTGMCYYISGEGRGDSYGGGYGYGEGFECGDGCGNGRNCYGFSDGNGCGYDVSYDLGFSAECMALS